MARYVVNPINGATEGKKNLAKKGGGGVTAGPKSFVGLQKVGHLSVSNTELCKRHPEMEFTKSNHPTTQGKAGWQSRKASGTVQSPVDGQAHPRAQRVPNPTLLLFNSLHS